MKLEFEMKLEVEIILKMMRRMQSIEMMWKRNHAGDMITLAQK